MIEKYTRPEMGRIWSTENKYENWLRVEVAVAEVWADEGRVPREALENIRRATFDLRRIAKIEEETQHDVIAFLRNLEERVGADARWIHLGLTSSDIVDTGLALQLVESTDLLLRDVAELRAVLAGLALRHRDALMMGRTHNVHAEPITFGHKVAVWYAEMGRHLTRLQNVRNETAVGKIAGAVGTHANVSPSVEEEVAKRLGLQVEEAATQIVQRDRHASYLLELALLASSLDRISTELRNLQRTEIAEVEEPFKRGQQGSSAMPHKRNPILNERISGLARVMRGYAVPALENVVLWHERDISNSSVERIILPEASILADYMLGLLTRILRDMSVNEDRMRQNLDATQGLYFSERVLTVLIEKGMSRQDAYLAVQRAAMRSRQETKQFRRAVEQEPEISARLSPHELDRIFDPRAFVQHVDAVYARVGLDGAGPESPTRIEESQKSQR
ncbi:MAG TPA: adenylosuccinate lyase [Chloroflexota bacterium]